MSRPKNLPPSLQAWATGNYAAGPTWGSTPQRAAPGASFLTPGVSLPAENENYLHGNAFDTAQATLNCIGQLPALNLNASATGAFPSTGAVAWSDFEQAWYAINSASSQVLLRSADYGKTFQSNATAFPTAVIPVDLAFDTSGNCVMVGSLGRVQNAPFVAYGTNLVFTDRGLQVVFTGGNPTQLVYEPTNALWCVIGTTGTVISVYTSSNQTTWTAHAFPATWNINAFAPTMGVGNGLVVAAIVSAAATFRTIRSADGGVTWTNDQSISTSGTIATLGTTISPPVWSATDKLWYIAAWGTAGSKQTIIYSSPDAITWSVAAALTTNGLAIEWLVAIGSLIIGVNLDGRVSASVNQGVNWSRCSFAGGAPITAGLGVATVRGGGGGFGVAIASGFVTSTRIGLPTLAV